MVDEVTEETKCIHYWVIDSKDIGICKYCKQVRDFSRLQNRESKLLGLRSVSNKAEVNTKRSAAAKERWQDPAFRAKMKAIRSHCYEQQSKTKTAS